MGGRDRPEPPEVLTDPKRPRIVVVGAGFGGLWAVRRFVSHGLAVTLIDRNNYHTFFPLLYQVAAAELGPSEIAYPVRSLFRRHPLVDFRRAKVHRIDLDARIVKAEGTRLQYDYLVMALGSGRRVMRSPFARWMTRSHSATTFWTASSGRPRWRTRPCGNLYSAS